MHERTTARTILFVSQIHLLGKGFHSGYQGFGKERGSCSDVKSVPVCSKLASCISPNSCTAGSL